MKINDKKILIFEILFFLFLFLNIFIKNVLSENLLCILIAIAFFISTYLIGFRKNKNIYRKKVTKAVIFLTISFLIIMYGLGLIKGYVKSPYSYKLLVFLKNIIPIIITIIFEELLRYNLLLKSKNTKIYKIISFILFYTLDIFIISQLYNLNDRESILEMITVGAIPLIFENIMLTDFSSEYGYNPCIGYKLCIRLYSYIMPITPDLDIYIKSIIMLFIPILTRFIVNIQFKHKKKTKMLDIKENDYLSKLLSGLVISLVIILIALCSNLFSFWIAVVGSGSMEPTINIGDAVIIDKRVKKNMSKLKVNDVIVFKIKNKIYTHRIVEIKEENNTYSYKTKGDRIGNAIDSWNVTEENIIGKVKYKISYVGYPTIWLNNFIRGD